MLLSFSGVYSSQSRIILLTKAALNREEETKPVGGREIATGCLGESPPPSRCGAGSRAPRSTDSGELAELCPPGRNARGRPLPIADEV